MGGREEALLSICGLSPGSHRTHKKYDVKLYPQPVKWDISITLGHRAARFPKGMFNQDGAAHAPTSPPHLLPCEVC